MNRLAPLAVIVLLALAGCGADDPVNESGGVPEQQRALAGAPAPLAALHAQANEIVGGGPDAFRDQLRALKGHPVVVNKWASWCGPCRFEFPFFQSQALKRGKEVAFLGLNSGDNREDAQAFLRKLPTSFPSFEDPREQIARSLGASLGYPTTIFFDSRGRRRFIHQGVYASEEKLARDIARYAT